MAKLPEYIPTQWNNDLPPAISAENLNKIETGLANLSELDLGEFDLVIRTQEEWAAFLTDAGTGKTTIALVAEDSATPSIAVDLPTTVYSAPGGLTLSPTIRLIQGFGQVKIATTIFQGSMHSAAGDVLLGPEFTILRDLMLGGVSDDPFDTSTWVNLKIENCSSLGNFGLESGSADGLTSFRSVSIADPPAVGFGNCNGLNNITSTAATFSFNNCGYISNVILGSVYTATYTNCTHVDPFTCHDYMSAGTTGQVLTKTADGEEWQDAGGVPFIISATAPTDLTKLWIDTANSNLMKFHNGTTWVSIAAAWA